MINLSQDELANLLSYWLFWTFRPEFLKNITADTLNRFSSEYADYEYETEIPIEVWKTAWLYYFDNEGKLTDDIIEAVENL